MDERIPQASPPRVPVARQWSPSLNDCSDQEEELRCEELEERLAPGGTCYSPKKTAGWGC
jgi:hypothetical protein